MEQFRLPYIQREMAQTITFIDQATKFSNLLVQLIQFMCQKGTRTQNQE